MKSLASALFAGIALAGKPDYEHMWQSFKATYGKSYDTNNNEEQQRFGIFRANVDYIDEHNSKGLSWTLGINEFADLTADEFFDSHTGYNPGKPKGVKMSNVTTDVADSVDWVSKGAVTPVKNQAHCGSCWAFSTTGSVEGAYFVASGKLVSLSEEDLVQCDHNGDQGCKGGLMDNAFEFIQQAGGICSEQAYPYTSGGGITGTCRTPKCSPLVTISGHEDVPQGDETSLKAAVSKQPVSVAIEADKSAFQLYSGGVLDNPSCGKQLDHGVLVVGYGSDGGKDYWKVKNSWGPTWGEQGYIRMVRNKDQCGIATQPCYPTGATAVAPGPGPSPGPTPSPGPAPPPAASHYEDPKGGCQSDELDIQIQGVAGSVCSPSCSLFHPCPTDIPSGVTAHPQCALQDASTNKKYCALICEPSRNDDQCGTNASCKSIQTVGICTYDDAIDADAHLTVKYISADRIVV